MASRVALSSLLATIALLLVLRAPALVVAENGQSTYYGPPFVPSSCYGYDTSPFPAGNLIAAASPGLFNRNGPKSACGVSYEVRCLGATSGAANACKAGTVTVKIVDLCPGCHEPGLDLSPQAFNMISNTDVGRINVDFTRV